MKKFECEQLYKLIKTFDARSIDSTVRSKLLSIMVGTKGVVTSIDEAKKVFLDGMTDDEKRLHDIRMAATLRMQNGDHTPLSEEENHAINAMKQWDEAFAKAITRELSTEVELKFDKLTSDELDMVVDNNSVTMDTMAFLYETIVSEK